MSNARDWLGLALGLSILGTAGMPAIVGAAVVQDDPITFDLVVPERPFAFFPDALPDAAGTVTVTPGDGVDELALELTGLPPDASYNVFLAESGAPPFGAIQYLADVDADADGAAEVTVRTAALGAFALRGIASEGMLDPEAIEETRADLDHVVVWPKDPKTTGTLFEEQGEEPVATPFDADGEAGPVVLTSGGGPGPLAVEAAAAGGYDAAAAASVLVGEDPALGAFLTDADGMTLYRFTKDRPNESTCDGDCAAAWPPFAVAGDLVLPDGVGGELATITREDGSKQVTYDGAPLYYWAADQRPGDATGHGVNGVWFVVEPVTP